MVSVEVCTLGAADEMLVERFLAAHADGVLCLNLAAGLVDANRCYHGIWAGAGEGGNLVAVAQHTPIRLSRGGNGCSRAPSSLPGFHGPVTGASPMAWLARLL